MKIIIEHYDKKLTYEMSDDCDLNQMVDTFDILLRCVGYVYDGKLDIVVEEDHEDKKDSD